MVFGFKVDEKKRVARNKSLELKAKRLRERNKAVGSLERAKAESSKIRIDRFKRKTAAFKGFSKKVKSSIKKSWQRHTTKLLYQTKNRNK